MISMLLEISQKTILPIKRTQKKKLSTAEKERNREIAKKRIIVEYVFAAMKRFQIIGSLFRDNLKIFQIHKILYQILLILQI